MSIWSLSNGAKASSRLVYWFSAHGWRDPEMESPRDGLWKRPVPLTDDSGMEKLSLRSTLLHHSGGLRPTPVTVRSSWSRLVDSLEHLESWSRLLSSRSSESLSPLDAGSKVEVIAWFRISICFGGSAFSFEVQLMSSASTRVSAPKFRIVPTGCPSLISGVFKPSVMRKSSDDKSVEDEPAKRAFFGDGEDASSLLGLRFRMISLSTRLWNSGFIVQNPPFPGSSFDRATFWKHLFSERLCRIEFWNRNQ